MNESKLNKVLLYVIAGLVLIIIAGSIFGLIRKKNNSPEVLISQGKAENLVAPVDDTEIAYFELGTMRIMPEPTSEYNSVMVVSPWLAYPAGDTVFFEELARKQGIIKGIFMNYFSSRTRDKILEETEEKIISNLIEEINQKLSLGKISNIYYTDYLFLE